MRFDGAQLSVEVCSPSLRIVRVAGVLDRVTVGRLAGLVATQVTRVGRPGNLVVDMGEVSFFATDDFGALRMARDGARGAGIRLHLAGVSAREPLLPEAITAAFAEFSMFQTVESAERELMGRRDAVTPAGRPRSSHSWPCPPATAVDDDHEARQGTTVTG